MTEEEMARVVGYAVARSFEKFCIARNTEDCCEVDKEACVLADEYILTSGEQ